jgi:hypothetical protein
MKGGGHWVWRSKQCSEEIINRQPHVVTGRRGHWLLVIGGIPDELEEQASCTRFTATAKSILRLESQVGNQWPARQLQRKPLPIPLLGDVCHGPCRIDECNIAHGELHGSIILNHRRVARDLKYGITMIDTIEMNIPLRPLNTVSIATKIHGYEAA